MPQTPALHDAVPFATVQGTAEPHCPFASQVCTAAPEHCRAPGEHGTQAPFKQADVLPLHALSVGA